VALDGAVSRSEPGPRSSAASASFSPFVLSALQNVVWARWGCRLIAPMALTDAQARQALTDPAGAQSYVAMLGIACGLDGQGAALPGGIATGLAARIMMMEHRCTWRRSSDRGPVAKYPYQPYRVDPALLSAPSCRIAVALDDGDEGPLRAFAGAVAPPLIRARLFDVLWERFHRPEDAAHAIDEFVRVTDAAAGETWPEGDAASGRAAVLIGLRKDDARAARLLTSLEGFGRTVLSGTFYFALAPVAETFAATVLRSRYLGLLASHDVRERWSGTLEWIAESFFGTDAHYGRTAYEALAELFAASGRQDDAARVRRRLVAHLLACAAVNSALIGSSHATAALDVALTHGFSDLVEDSKKVLHNRVQASAAEMKTVSIPLSVSDQLVGEIDNAVDSSPSAASAIRTLAGLVGLCDVPVEATERAAKEQLNESVFVALFPSAHFRDGKVTFRGNDPETKLREAVARNNGAHLAIVEHLLARALVRLADRLSPSSLAEAVAEWPWLQRKRHVWLQRAAERFHAGDFMSSGLIVATQYEGIVRDLLRVSGVSALKTDSEGILMDETLGSLLKNASLRGALGGDHLRFVEFVMCDSQMGPNIRNEVAHGNAAPWDMTAPRVFLMWLFILRLTFLAPSAPTKSEVTEKLPGD
jgi:Domain of unknown function (DUF4209)